MKIFIHHAHNIWTQSKSQRDWLHGEITARAEISPYNQSLSLARFCSSACSVYWLRGVFFWSCTNTYSNSTFPKEENIGTNKPPKKIQLVGFNENPLYFIEFSCIWGEGNNGPKREGGGHAWRESTRLTENLKPTNNQTECMQQSRDHRELNFSHLKVDVRLQMS